MSQYSKPLIAFFCISAFVLSASLSYIGLSILGVFKGRDSTANIVSATAVTPTELPEGVVNFVFLGHGGPGHQAGSLMDSIIAVSVDPKAKKALVVSIPRDTWIEGRKINEGFVAGGYDLIKHQVNVVTGIMPTNYVAVDFDEYVKLINELGGVEANILKPYEDRFYPIRGRENDRCGFTNAEFAELHVKYSGYDLERQFECRYEHIKYDVGKNHMDGDDALKYVRSRHGDGDFGRSERQFVILNAAMDKVLSLDVLGKVGPVLTELFDTVDTNLSLDKVVTLSQLFLDPSSYDIKQIHLTDANVLRQGKGPVGQFILTPKEGNDVWTAVHSFVASE